MAVLSISFKISLLFRPKLGLVSTVQLISEQILRVFCSFNLTQMDMCSSRDIHPTKQLCLVSICIKWFLISSISQLYQQLWTALVFCTSLEHIHTYIHACIHPSIRPCTYIHTRLAMLCIYTNEHTHTYIRTNIYTHNKFR